MPSTEDSFARLVSLAVHDLRTPLATVSGFARTLQRSPLGEPADKYVEMMVAAGAQLADLLEEVGLAARIESGRWEPNVQAVDARDLADAAASRLDGVDSAGTGAEVNVDRDAAELALHGLARCAKRHGGLERVTLTADGTTVAVTRVTPAAAPILLGEEPRDLGALVAARVVAALGGSLELDGERLLVRLPA
jgi:light-regulated signal transduction histidine kinase (bacteriophytochrome)